jgi:hypothetical protein
MPELSPYIQRLLTKLQEEFEEIEQPVVISLHSDSIDVETRQEDYKMRVKRAKTCRTSPLSERISRQIIKYQQDIINAVPKGFQIPLFDGTIEAKLDHYLDKVELAQAQKNNTLYLEAYAKIGRVVAPYDGRPKDLKTIRRIIEKKGYKSAQVLKIAYRASILIQKRGDDVLYDYQWITPWVLYRMTEESWGALISTAEAMDSLSNINSQELIFEDRVLLPE